MFDHLVQEKIEHCMDLRWQSNKSNGLHNKGCYHKGQYNVTFFCIMGLCIQKQKAHDNLCFPLRRAYLLPFSIYFYARVISIHSHFNLNYSLVGKHHVVGKDLGTYGQSNIFDHDLLLLTIISMINELGGETLSPYLSLCRWMPFVLKICFEY